jgi:hypothetical protein
LCLDFATDRLVPPLLSMNCAEYSASPGPSLSPYRQKSNGPDLLELAVPLDSEAVRTGGSLLFRCGLSMIGFCMAR